MKARRRYASKRRSSARRWHIPPPLIHGSDTLEGGGILQDWGNELGVLLWQSSRDALLWATTEPSSRGGSFSARTAPDPFTPLIDSQTETRVRAALRVLRQIAREPESVREEQVARACRQISEWAESEGRLETALAFAQNAALAAASDPSAAFWVATVAVRLNDHARAEVWFRRAIGLARRARDWRMYSRAFGGLGNLYMRRGNLPSARRLHTRALRGARRGGMRREQAAALHDLFAVAVETGQPPEAERLARLALEAYGTRSARVHVLAHDVAYFWMDHGHDDRALAVFQAVLPLIEKPVERLFVIADIARAAAGTGDRDLAFDSAAEVHRLIREPELEQGAARALLEVARGYHQLDEHERAEEAARQAIAFATRFRESKVRFAAEALLESLLGIAAQVQAPAPVAAPPSENGSGDQLAAQFVKTLEMMTGATH